MDVWILLVILLTFILVVVLFDRVKLGKLYKQKTQELSKANAQLDLKLMELSDMYDKAEQQAITDGLTDVYNHRYFQHQLQKEFDRANRYHRPLSLLLLDIDYFKNYNDINGHVEGDNCLKILTEIVANSLRESDWVARYGGEEFAVVLPETPLEGAYTVAENLREFIEEYPFSLQEKLPNKNLTVSIGIANFPVHAASKKELIDYCDRALLYAKEKGRNNVIYLEHNTNQ